MLSSEKHRVAIVVLSASALFFSVTSPSGLAQTAPEQAASRHFAAAHQAQEAGNLDQAAQEYVAVLRLLPDTAEVYASLGMVYNAQGKYADSAKALAKANRLKPGLPGVSLYLGIDYEQQHLAASAVPPLEEAVRQDAASKDANIWLGRALWEAGREQQALAQFRRSTVLFPADPALLLESGESYHKAAEDGIGHVLEEAHGSPLAHQVYGDVYTDERAWSNAMAHYYRALELNPQWPGAHFGLGDVAFHQGKWEIARQQYELELKTHPGSAPSLARLAELLLLAGKPEDALALLETAIALSGYEAANALGLPHGYPASSEDVDGPTHPDGTEDAKRPERANLSACQAALQNASPSPARSLALALAGKLLGDSPAFAANWQDFTQQLPPAKFANALEHGKADFYRQDFEAAAVHLDTWNKTHPTDLQAQYLLATAYRNLSLKTLAQLLDTAPDSYPAHILLAETYQNAEQDAKALEEFRAAAAMAPDVPGVHYQIGHLLAKTGQAEPARAEFAAELQINPTHAAANAAMGTLLLDGQDTAHAIPYLEKALQADPDQWTTYSELGKAYYAQKDFVKAETALRQAVRHDPQGLAHYQLGLVYRALGQKEAANAQFDISRKLKLDALTRDETKMTTLKDLPQ